MMLPGEPIRTNERLASLGLAAYPSTTGEALGAAAEEAWATNPSSSAWQLLRQGARSPGPAGVGAEFGREGFGPDIPSAPMLTPEEATERYGIEGHLAFKEPVAEETARDFRDAKQAELARKDVFARSQGGALLTAAELGTGFAVSLLDPLNVASAFIPVVGPTRYALALERAGAGTAARAAARARLGAVEGAAGAALLEPMVYGAATQRQADYDAVDSLMNIGFGTVLGGGLHAGLGALGDAIARNRMAEPALRGSVAAVVEDRPVQVGAPLLKAINEAPPSDFPGDFPGKVTTGGRDAGFGGRLRDIILSAERLADDPKAFAEMLADLRQGDPGIEGQRLLTFLQAQGGLRDDGGELAHMGINSKTRPGLVRPEGLELDHARELAQEAGYLRADDPDAPPRADVNDLLDAIREDFAGRGVYLDPEAELKLEAAAQRDRLRSELAGAGIDLKRPVPELQAEVRRLASEIRAEDARLDAEIDRLFDETVRPGPRGDEAPAIAGVEAIVARAGVEDPAAAIEAELAELDAAFRAVGLEDPSLKEADELVKSAEARAKAAEAAAACQMLQAAE